MTCTELAKDADGRIAKCAVPTIPRAGGWTDDGRKVMGTLHWVSCGQAVDLEIRLYDRLFGVEKPEAVEEGVDYKSNLNPDSLSLIQNAKGEPALADAPSGSQYQFLRQGYFAADPDGRPEKPVFNLSVKLKDSWKK